MLGACTPKEKAAASSGSGGFLLYWLPLWGKLSVAPTTD